MSLRGKSTASIVVGGGLLLIALVLLIGGLSSCGSSPRSWVKDHYTAAGKRGGADVFRTNQNVAQVTGAEFDPDTANNSTNVTTTVGPATDLQLSKGVDRATAAVGDTVTYTLAARNDGPSAATNVVVTDALRGDVRLARTRAQQAGEPRHVGGVLVPGLGLPVHAERVPPQQEQRLELAHAGVAPPRPPPLDREQAPGIPVQHRARVPRAPAAPPGPPGASGRPATIEPCCGDSSAPTPRRSSRSGSRSR